MFTSNQRTALEALESALAACGEKGLRFVVLNGELQVFDPNHLRGEARELALADINSLPPEAYRTTVSGVKIGMPQVPQPA